MTKKMTGFIAMLLIVVMTICLIPTTSFAQDDTAEIATWSGFRKGAATFTFDDGAPSHISDVAPLFDGYGYKASFYLVNNWNPDWEGFQKLADNGHEIGSHSNNHPQNMTGEEASSKANINSKITSDYNCITVAYPNNNVPDESAVLQNYIAGRLLWVKESEEMMSKDGPSNWAKVPATMTGSQSQIKNTNDFTGRMTKAVQAGGWVVFVTHGFSGKTNGNATYSPTDINAIDGALSWAKQNDKNIWVSTLGAVAMYIKERKASKIELKESDASTKIYSLKHTIADGICKYQYPLSIRVRMPDTWSDVKVTQGDAILGSKVESGYIYFDAVPNGGDIIVKNSITTSEATATPVPTAVPSTTKPDTAATPTPTSGVKTSDTDNPSVTASDVKTVIKKINKKAKTSDKLKITVKKVTGAKWYEVRVFDNQKKAKKNKKFIFEQVVKKNKFTINSKKFKNKKKLYVRVRTFYGYSQDSSTIYRETEWSAVKNVKIK